jgi:hypothetical protein
VAYLYLCVCVSGTTCGLATHVFHNAALTAGRMAADGVTQPGNMECMRRLFAEQGVKAFYFNFPLRVGIIAFWSGVLTVTQPFGWVAVAATKAQSIWCLQALWFSNPPITCSIMYKTALSLSISNWRHSPLPRSVRACREHAHGEDKRGFWGTGMALPLILIRASTGHFSQARL